MLTLMIALLGCGSAPTSDDDGVEGVDAEAPAEDCSGAKNTCADYSTSWVESCPDGERCITLKNSCPDPVAVAYQVGCNGDGTPGAPQCNCTDGPVINSGDSIYWTIVDADYTSCMPSWTPPCLTAGLALIVNETTADCTKGTRLEFTAGNSANEYGKFDSYNIDVEKDFYSIPVSFAPDITCAVDHENHDCRPLWCGEADCPDAYDTPTSGGCADGRSPQGACQDTFGDDKGYTIELCPSTCTASSCPSCQDATACLVPEAKEVEAGAEEVETEAATE